MMIVYNIRRNITRIANAVPCRSLIKIIYLNILKRVWPFKGSLLMLILFFLIIKIVISVSKVTQPTMLTSITKHPISDTTTNYFLAIFLVANLLLAIKLDAALDFTSTLR